MQQLSVSVYAFGSVFPEITRIFGLSPRNSPHDLLYQVSKRSVMTRTIELSEELVQRIEQHMRDDETIEEFIQELVSIYEHEGRFTQEGP